MSASLLVYLFGMGSVFAGERLLSAYPARWAVDALGIVALVLALYLRANARKGANGTLRDAHGRLLAFSAVGIASLVLYALSTRDFTSLLGLSDSVEIKWRGVMGVAWPLVWLGATLPLITLDRAVDQSPVMMPKRRLEQATLNGLIAALGFALVFPVNYVASRHTKAWDYSYFKTSQAGTATQSIVNSLKSKVEVVVFQPTSSEVTPELLRYFEALEGPNLSVSVVDQAANPKLAQELRVRNNGTIALSVKAEEKEADAKVQFVEVGTELKRARANLKKLDQEVHKALLILSRGELRAYITEGHGELSWDRAEPENRRISGFKQVLEYSGFRVSKLGMKDGLGEEVPEDAALVAILGPTRPFLQAEIDALKRYVDRGGSLFVALEPMQPDGLVTSVGLEPLLEALGVRQEEGVLVSDQQVVQVTGGKLDRLNITTGSFSTHESTAVLATSPSGMLFSRASSLAPIPNSKANAVATVRTSAQTWLESDGNLDFNADAKETRLARPLVMASSQSSSGHRAVITGDATMLSDFAIIARGNQQFLLDSLGWLSKTEAYSGSTESEEDVRIQHTREGQAGWFYLTVLGFPLIVLMVGFIRVRRRGGRG